ncbi:MAG: GNAT family N-acetyltransferase [Bacteroidales bacterium]|nr:GNAT family N-acetyltransferase [Bacteroidales bacterium]
MKIISISTVKGRCELMQFIRFPFELYKNCPQWVPSFESDEVNSLSEKNPSLSFCERELYLARCEGKIVGRIAAIMNHNANKKWGEKVVRFGWLDFVDDIDVLKSLIDAVLAWGKERGAEKIKGPLGFTDMDREGLLVEGFEKDCPFTVIYNYPYYGEYLEKLGFRKDADWTQRVIEIGEKLPSMFQYASLIENRFKLKVFQPKSNKELAPKGKEMFHVLNDAFAPLYEYSKLSEEQIDSYVKQYVPVMNKDLVALVLNEKDEMVGFCVTMPSISKAVRKAKGRLFPFGFIPILRSLKHNDTIEALLIGVLPEYQGKGVNVLLFKYIHENCIRLGIKRMLLNPQLEENYKVQTLFEEYNPQPYMRRRSYVKDAM